MRPLTRSDITWKPLDTWPPGELRADYTRQRSRFDSGFGQTLHLLFTELGHLRATDVVIEADLTGAQIRVSDGWPRAASKIPAPIKLSFSSKHGPLVYATDLYRKWDDNLRAIAVGLEALRKVDRHGITDHGQQYAGWAALPAGYTTGETRQQAAHEIVAFVTGCTPSDETVAEVLSDPVPWVKRARALAHPDSEHGHHDAFIRVQGLAEKLILP